MSLTMVLKIGLLSSGILTVFVSCVGLAFSASTPGETRNRESASHTAKTTPQLNRPPASIPAAISRGESAYPIESSAQFLDKLFGDACIPNLDRPEGVRSYALNNHLTQVTNPQALALYVGRGEGAAWVVLSEWGQFMLSLRGLTQSCAVWSQEANPLAVETYFRARIESLTTPGAKALLDNEATQPTSHGELRWLAFSVVKPYKAESIQMLMMVSERPGGPFQAMYQIGSLRASVTPAAPLK